MPDYKIDKLRKETLDPIFWTTVSLYIFVGVASVLTLLSLSLHFVFKRRY